MSESTHPTISPSDTARPEPATAGHQGSETQVGSVFVSNYPPFSAWSKEQLAAAEEALTAPPENADEPFGLYLHLPFCRKRCKFCYFRVYTDKNSGEIGRYTDALAKEVEIYAGKPALAGRPLRFVYFGGGTPSYISVRHLTALVERLRQAFSWDAVEEVTFECEPGTLTRSKLAAIRELGITRLSLGIENFNDAILRENGRAHLTKEIDRVLPWIEELDFDQLNVDLIAGMVGETWDTWRETVARTVDLAPDSVTVYQMELPFNARFSQKLLDGEGLEQPLADWETKRAWNDFAIEQLAAAGYEVSSAYTMIRPGKKASRFLYRDALWHGSDLIGTGIASFSHFQGVHFQNTASWADYLAGIEAGELPWFRAFETAAEDRLTRELILQLKLGEISPESFEQKFGVDVLRRYEPAWKDLEERGMLSVEPSGAVELTRAGLLQVDSLLPNFYAETYRGARYT
ncbi:MAG: coproporphyrinogen-III oxidase family protein [Acidobacteriota bacterium]